MNLIKHLLSRHYDPSRYIHQTLDFKRCMLSVHLTNLSGQIVGFQQYNPMADKKINNGEEGRYWTIVRRGVSGYWGIESLNPSKPDLFVVEGIFKASALHMLGKNAIAVLSSRPTHLREFLHALPYRLIGIGDNDKAGGGIIEVCGRGFKSEKDIDEYSLVELESLLKEKGY